jgi:hypothetical protein
MLARGADRLQALSPPACLRKIACNRERPQTQKRRAFLWTHRLAFRLQIVRVSRKIRRLIQKVRIGLLNVSIPAAQSPAR